MNRELLRYKREPLEVKKIFLKMITPQMNQKGLARGKDNKEIKSKFLKTSQFYCVYRIMERKWGFHNYLFN